MFDNTQKYWLSVHKHIGYQVQMLMNAEMNDDQGYRIEPPLVEHPSTGYKTVQAAVDAINAHGVLII